MEETGISMQNRFLGYQRRNIKNLPSFLDTLQATLLTNVKRVYVEVCLKCCLPTLREYTSKYGLKCCLPTLREYTSRYGLKCCLPMVKEYTSRYGLKCCLPTLREYTSRYGLKCCLPMLREYTPRYPLTDRYLDVSEWACVSQ